MSCIWKTLGFDGRCWVLMIFLSQAISLPSTLGTAGTTSPSLRLHPQVTLPPVPWCCSHLAAYLSTLLFSQFPHSLCVYLTLQQLRPSFIHCLFFPASALRPWLEPHLFIFLTFASLSSVSVIRTSILFTVSITLLISDALPAS